MKKYLFILLALVGLASCDQQRTKEDIQNAIDKINEQKNKTYVEIRNYSSYKVDVDFEDYVINGSYNLYPGKKYSYEVPERFVDNSFMIYVHYVDAPWGTTSCRQAYMEIKKTYNNEIEIYDDVVYTKFK